MNKHQRINRPDHVWQDPELAQTFLEGIRGGVPFAAEQIDILLRVLRAAGAPVRMFLDLGCGDGVLGRALLAAYPASRGVFLDLSDTMLGAARTRLTDEADRVRIVPGDFGVPSWVSAVNDHTPFDLIVSGFAIHHQPDARKRELYGEILQLLRPGGMFLHLEHVASASSWAESAFDELMIDGLLAYHLRRGESMTRQEVADRFVQRKDWSANILAPLELQCRWLRELGFVDVDCYFKAFELALFGGRRAAA